MSEIKRNIVVLVDGHNVVYRAYHAIRSLTTQAGIPTNALFGFIRMLEQVRRIWLPTHWCVCFDGGLPAARMDILPGYKAQRPPMPELLRPQFGLIEEYLDSARIPRLRVDGEEADDVLAALCTRAAGDGARVLVVSSDKDLSVLVGDHTSIVPPSEVSACWGPAEVTARTGIRPEQVPDWLALTGDTVDNIDGVPGIGPKTAAALLRQFDTLSALWDRLDEVANVRIRELLRMHRERVARNVGLVRLRTECALPVDWRDCPAVPAPVAPLREFYRRMELHSLLKALTEPELF